MQDNLGDKLSSSKCRKTSQTMGPGHRSPSVLSEESIWRSTCPQIGSFLIILLDSGWQHTPAVTWLLLVMNEATSGVLADLKPAGSVSLVFIDVWELQRLSFNLVCNLFDFKGSGTFFNKRKKRNCFSQSSARLWKESYLQELRMLSEGWTWRSPAVHSQACDWTTVMGRHDNSPENKLANRLHESPLSIPRWNLHDMRCEYKHKPKHKKVACEHWESFRRNRRQNKKQHMNQRDQTECLNDNED